MSLFIKHCTQSARQQPVSRLCCIVFPNIRMYNYSDEVFFPAQRPPGQLPSSSFVAVMEQRCCFAGTMLVYTYVIYRHQRAKPSQRQRLKCETRQTTHTHGEPVVWRVNMYNHIRLACWVAIFADCLRAIITTTTTTTIDMHVCVCVCICRSSPLVVVVVAVECRFNNTSQERRTLALHFIFLYVSQVVVASRAHWRWGFFFHAGVRTSAVMLFR